VLLFRLDVQLATSDSQQRNEETAE